jgi:hypothetical protein
MQIDGMVAYENKIEKNFGRDNGESESSTLCEGIGVEECESDGTVKHIHTKKETAMNLVTTEKSTDSHYDFTFEFSYEFSTALDSRVAGAPSDVIIGGGMDIIVSDIIQGTQYYHIIAGISFLNNLSLYVYYISNYTVFIDGPNTDAITTCMYADIAQAWQPAKVTTWIMTPLLITATQERLQRQINAYNTEVLSVSDDNPQAKANATVLAQENVRQLQTEIDNWQTVLNTYRGQSTSGNSSAMFTSEALQYNNMVKAFGNWYELLLLFLCIIIHND